MSKPHLADHLQLAELGHAQSFQRQFSKWSMLGLSFAILNTWAALAAGLSFALPSGGPTAVLWGFITAGVCNLSLAASLAEFLSAYPTAGGQYHWVAVMSPPSLKRGLSWVTGWVNLAGWVALVATNGVIESSIILYIAQLEHPGYEPKRWHQFLIYIGATLITFAINAFGNRLLPVVNQVALIWSIAGFIIISIAVLACAAPDYATAEYVFTNFTNSTGWPDGLAWLLGLLQGALSLTGFDAVAHMVSHFRSPFRQGDKLTRTDRRDSQRRHRRPEDHALLPIYRHFHRLHLPYRCFVRIRRRSKPRNHHLFSLRPSAPDSVHRHIE